MLVEAAGGLEDALAGLFRIWRVRAEGHFAYSCFATNFDGLRAGPHRNRLNGW